MRAAIVFGLCLSVVSGWLLAGEDPTATSELHRAIFEDESERALRLLEEGADPNASNRYGVTPLSLACQNGNALVMNRLLEHGASPNQKSETGETPLMIAAKVGKINPVRILLEHGADLKGKNATGQDALMWAAAEGHAEVTAFFIEQGIDPNRSLKSGFTPMLFAARGGHGEVIELLLAAGVDVNRVSATSNGGRGLPKGSSALSIAVENGHFAVAEQLLQAGADPNDQRSGATPLHILTWVRKPNRGDGFDGMPSPRGSGPLNALDFAALLMNEYEAEVDPSLTNPRGSRFGMRGDTPFILAARKADFAYLRLLYQSGANLAAENSTGTTALLAVAGVDSRTPEEEAGTEEEALEVVEWLFSLGADVNHVNRVGETSMHGAAYRNFPTLIHWLSDHGAEVERWNQNNRKRWTPLLIARGYRPGNFKPSAATEAALIEVMTEAGVEIPPIPNQKPPGQY